MTHIAKKLDKKFLLGHWIRTWDYRGFIIQAKHYSKTPNLVIWSILFEDGSSCYAQTKTRAKEIIDRKLGE